VFFSKQVGQGPIHRFHFFFLSFCPDLRKSNWSIRSLKRNRIITRIKLKTWLRKSLHSKLAYRARFSGYILSVPSPGLHIEFYRPSIHYFQWKILTAVPVLFQRGSSVINIIIFSLINIRSSVVVHECMIATCAIVYHAKLPHQLARAARRFSYGL
jgi:hypothetical protein